MRYAQIRQMDISNGEGIGISLFVQGCRFHCNNCFNSETWDFNGGNEWTPEVKKHFFKLAQRPYITRVSFLGGEPLDEVNMDEVFKIIKELRECFPEKKIWLYTGFTWETIFSNKVERNEEVRQSIVRLCDVVVDGLFVDSQKDMSLLWAGSANQRVINVSATLEQEQIVTW